MSANRTDTESRELIESLLDRNLLVEAAAGTGKTHSIVSRMVNLIATGTCDIERLAAVTFTRKAASELRERFHTRITTESKSEDRDADQINRLRVAANNIDQSFVGTFHAFCSMLLRERPIECGVDPGFREIEEQEDAQLRDEAWRNFLSVLYSSNDERLDQMEELGLKAKDLRQCFGRLAEFPDVTDWPHTPPKGFDLDVIRQETRDYVEDIRGLLPLFPDERGTDKLMYRYEEIVRKANNIKWNRRGEFFELLELFSSSRKATQKWWHEKSVAKAESNRFADFRVKADHALSWWYGYRYEFLVRLLREACNTYHELRRASGGLDFQDLLLTAAASLKTQPRLREYFQRRFTHLLVDEFQDTDPIQAEVLAFLASANHDEQDWQKCYPRPGSLFLVGDPKQSIYRFRRADIVTYKQVRDMLLRGGGEVIQLSKSFRCVDEIREWNNQVFSDFFGSTETPYSPAAVDMEAGRDDQADGVLKGVYRLPVPNMRRDDAVLFEAEEIAKYIQWAINSKQTVPRTDRDVRVGKSVASPGDFLIVSWNKRSLGVYGDALDRCGIPNEVTGSHTFSKITELKTLLACLRAIDDSRNPIPYVAVLRSDLFGFSDADLYEITSRGGRLAYTSKPPAELPEPLLTRLTKVNESLAQYLRWVRNLPLAAATCKIIDDLGLLAKAASGGQGNSVLGGFLKASEWLRAQSWEFDSATDLMGYLEQLTETVEAEGCTALPESKSVVRVMNLHKVKGLEAPIVFLAGVHGAARRHRPNFHVDRQNGAKGYLSISKEIGSEYKRTIDIARPSDWPNVLEEEQQFQAAERQRLLYVAATRAACQLVISTTERESNSHWQPFHEYLQETPELAWTALAEDVTEPPAGVCDSTSESLNDASARLDGVWKRARESGYSVFAAKELALKGSSRPNWHASGNYGHKWGTAVHELLDIRSRRPAVPLDSHAKRVVAELDLGLERIHELLATVQSVTKSDIWIRSEEASNCYSEIPFETVHTENSTDTLVRGVIDLVFEDTAGWVLVDYKTDDISERDVDEAAEYYDAQLRTYADVWTELTSAAVVERGLYFTKLQKFVSYRGS